MATMAVLHFIRDPQTSPVLTRSLYCWTCGLSSLFLVNILHWNLMIFQQLGMQFKTLPRSLLEFRRNEWHERQKYILKMQGWLPGDLDISTQYLLLAWVDFSPPMESLLSANAFLDNLCLNHTLNWQTASDIKFYPLPKHTHTHSNISPKYMKQLFNTFDSLCD